MPLCRLFNNPFFSIKEEEEDQLPQQCTEHCIAMLSAPCKATHVKVSPLQLPVEFCLVAALFASLLSLTRRLLHLQTYSTRGPKQPRLWTQPSGQRPREPQVESAAVQHLTNSHMTRAKVQAGALRLQNLRKQAKSELQACKV